MEYSEKVQHLYRQVIMTMECMMLKSKLARLLDQTEKEWTNIDTMVMDDNDTRNTRYMATLIVQVISPCYNTKQYHYHNLKHSSDQLHGLILHFYVKVPQKV